LPILDTRYSILDTRYPIPLNYSADIVFPIHLPPIKNGLVVVDEHGKIIDLLDPSKDEISDSLPVKKFDGIICPGFVNTHCHLELSYMKGKFTQKKGLPFFIGEMVEKRNPDDDKILSAITEADSEMYLSGIVAVGDISNNSTSSIIKQKSEIFYHTFIELFDIFPDRAESVLANGLKLQSEFSNAGQISSIVPHSPYTVTDHLLEMIGKHAAKTNGILCIHNQETTSENEMFENGSGALIEKLQLMTGAYSDWKPTSKSSLKSIINKLIGGVRLQLVHNTFTNADDIRIANKIHPSLFWCLCTNANLFIENALPRIENLMNEKCKMTIGTDSYASNWSLSILDELKTISKNFPSIPLNDLLEWSTINGATFLGIDKVFGSFERGKSPGINLISNIDFDKNCLLNKSLVKRLI
jgi:cytosine/adenosine deaminase-related metal-dependent hydrolase